MVKELKGKNPKIGENTFVAETAVIIGDVEVGKTSAIWYGCVIRGDISSIKIGDNSNIQDNSIIHVSSQVPTNIGNNVTVGHGAIIHGCTIGDNCLIGMNSVIMDHVKIGNNTIIGAMSMISKGKTIPDGVLVMGNPAKIIRHLTEEEIMNIHSYSSRNYENAKENYMQDESSR